MSEMVRKQFYIHKRHQILLGKLARAKGVSEAEIIRQAIEHEAAGSERRPLTADRNAWEEIIATVERRKALDVKARSYVWDRQEAYQEREESLKPSP